MSKSRKGFTAKRGEGEGVGSYLFTKEEIWAFKGAPSVADLEFLAFEIILKY